MANARVIRTFSMLGADGAGKTALVEALWRIADPKRAAGRGVDLAARRRARGEEAELHARRSTRRRFEDGGRAFNVLDCPGFAAFLTEVEWALQVTDGAVLAVSAADGAHNRAERTYDVLAESGRPAIGVITPHGPRAGRLREGARRHRGLAQGEARAAAAPDRRRAERARASWTSSR